jgi:hypothetical protein
LKPIHSSRKAKIGNYYQGGIFANHKHYAIHRLVAQAFIKNPLNKPCVNHLDGNPSNNNVRNLDWCTHSENQQWDYDKLNRITWNKGRKMPEFSGENNPSHKLSKEDVLEIRRLYANGSSNLSHCKLAIMFNVSYSNIYLIVNYKRWRNV